ncbi:5-hydroxytryptamine receptor 1A [Tupaia chinensis]|uniref:5-hydroxytryptamine receptor 1A n=1 Tax=Tupaia chinensis TaxID=246437 RepID=L9JJI3_TUPCH|nr:5-hydroxytryptamine receptor 1A [Tupaia chinensis]
MDVLSASQSNNTTSSQGPFETGGNATGISDVTLSYQVITSLLLGTLIFCAVLGNACVVAAIALERSLQNVANYLIGSLAVTDLMVSVLVLPMAALYQVLNKWTLGQVTCDLFIALDVLCCTSSILHLCAIALDRYWAITDPIDYVNKRTPRRAAALISLTWLIGFLISIPPMLGWRTPEDRSDPDACTISKDHGYTIYSTFGAFYIPLLLMLVLYGRIFRAARFRIRKTEEGWGYSSGSILSPSAQEEREWTAREQGLGAGYGEQSWRCPVRQRCSAHGFSSGIEDYLIGEPPDSAAGWAAAKYNGQRETDIPATSPPPRDPGAAFKPTPVFQLELPTVLDRGSSGSA